MMNYRFEDRLHSHPAFEEHVANVCARPGMYVPVAATLETICAYFDGFNTARNGGPLIGLQEWLIVRCRGGTNVAWTVLARMVLSIPRELPGDEKSIAALGELLGEFFKYRRESGLAKIFQDHNRWLSRQKWYDGPLRGK